MSRQNQRMDYWAGGLAGSRKCECGVSGTCVDRSKWCNCDAALDAWMSDDGELTEKEFLPVRQLRFGDTGTPLDNKEGRYTLGPLTCEGDVLYDNVVTFRVSDATIDFPTFDMGHSGDILFEFKTTTQNAVLIHSRGPSDYIKVDIHFLSANENHFPSQQLPLGERNELVNSELVAVQVSINGGDTLQFEYQAGSGPRTVTVETSNRLADNQWHTVYIERNRREARMIVDGALKVRPFLLFSLAVLLLLLLLP